MDRSPSNGWTFLLRRAGYLVPGSIFIVIAVALGVGLTLDSRIIPSVLIDKPVPSFTLPPVQGRKLGLANTDLAGAVSLVNVFASWCAPCRAEHPLLMQLEAEGTLPIHGLNYKDRPEDVGKWLDDLGDPYKRTGADLDGRTAIDWGVYGVPETFIVGADGRIAYKHVGPVTRKVLDETILPLVEQLREADMEQRQ